MNKTCLIKEVKSSATNHKLFFSSGSMEIGNCGRSLTGKLTGYLYWSMEQRTQPTDTAGGHGQILLVPSSNLAFMRVDPTSEGRSWMRLSTDRWSCIAWFVWIGIWDFSCRHLCILIYRLVSVAIIGPRNYQIYISLAAETSVPISHVDMLGYNYTSWSKLMLIHNYNMMAGV